MRKTAILNKATALLTALLFLSSFSVCPAFAADRFSLTDYSTDKDYTVVIDDNHISVSGAINYSFTNDYPAVSCCVYDGVFSFMSAYYLGEHNNGTAITVFNSKAGSVESYVLSERASRNKYCFAADSSGNVYFCSESNSCIVYCRNLTETGYSVSCDYSVKQILSIDGEHIMLVTSGGVYTLINERAVLTLSAIPDVPLNYCGNSVLCDAGGAEYNYSNGYMSRQNNTHTPPDTGKLKFDIREGVIYGIKAGSTVKVLKDEFAVIDESITVKDKDGDKVSFGKIGTGMTVQPQSIEELTVMIPGDMTGEGNINSRDLRLIMDALTDSVELNGVYRIAADLDGDENITTKDMLAMAKLIK